MSASKPPLPLPRALVDAARAEGSRAIALDWRKLARRKPPMWPGTLYLFRNGERAREDARLKALADETIARDLVFIGTNTCGILFALGRDGCVVILDAIELDCPVRIAKSFEALLAARAEEPEGRANARRP